MSQPSNSNIAKLVATREDVCLQWLRLTRELHGLSHSEMDVAAEFLTKYIDFKEKILDDELLNEYLMSTKVKNTIREKLGIEKQTSFQNLITNLRKKGFFNDQDVISKSFIPNIDTRSETFKIEFLIKINDKG